jgi:hypothetical protein
LTLLLLFVFSFGRWILAEETLEGIESAFPEAAVLGDPVFGLFQGSGGKAAEARTANLFLPDETGLLEDVDVLHHGGQGHAVRFGEIGQGSFAEHEGSEDGAASGVGESAKGGIEGCGILNHMV